MTKPLATLLDNPERALVALIAAQIAFWTLAPALSMSAPPLDVVEMYAWGREGVIATFKHPNLPGLLLEGLRRLTGQTGWPAYLLSQVCIGATFWAVFMLGREIMDAPRALAGTLLLTGVYFFSWVTPEFNHNVLQMPLWALTLLMLWRATTRGALLSWVLLGLFAGLGLWAKYSFAILLIVAAMWILWDSAARKRLATPGPWLALTVFALIATPQVLWLTNNDFLPFAYAARRASDGGPLQAFEFLLTQALNHLPMALLLLCAGLFGKTTGDAPPAPETRAMRFLWLMAFAPLALVALTGVFGAGLRASWGAPMFSLSGLIAVALLSGKFNAARLRGLAIGAGVLLVLVSGLFFGHMRYGALLTNKPLKGNWPQATITRSLERAWRETYPDLSLTMVAGDIWTAGLVGMNDVNPPSVWINGDLTTSPWITPERLRTEPYMVVWAGDGAAPPLVHDTTQAAHLVVPFKDFPNAPPLRINYYISERP